MRLMGRQYYSKAAAGSGPEYGVYRYARKTQDNTTRVTSDDLEGRLGIRNRQLRRGGTISSEAGAAGVGEAFGGGRI